MTRGGSSRGRSKSQGSDDAKEARSPARHSSDRRPLRFWQPFNDWWRSTLEEKEGRRPDAQEITVWYNEHAASLWKEDAPSLQETRIHAKCLRSLPLVRDYFRNYRARKRSVSDRSGSMGPGEDYDAMDQEDGDGGAGGGDPDYALRRRSGRGRSGSRGGGQRGRRRGARGATGHHDGEDDAMAEEDDDDVDGDAVAGLTQLANLAAAAQSASPSRDDGLDGGSDGDGEGHGDDVGGLGGGMSLDQLLAAPALLSPTTAALLAVHRAGLEAADGAGGGGAGAAGGLPGDLLQRLTMQAAVQQQFALAALAHNLAASQQAAATGGADEDASGAMRGSGEAGDADEGTLSGRSSKRQRTAATAGGAGPNATETGDDGAGEEASGRLGSRRSLRKETEQAADTAAPSGRGRSAGSWRTGSGDTNTNNSRQGGATKRRSQHDGGGGGSGPAGQQPLDDDSLAGLNGLAVAALELSGMGLPEPGGVVLPPPLELLHVPPALSLEPMGRDALHGLSREQLVDRVLLLQAHLQLVQQQQQQPAAPGLAPAGGSGALGMGGLPVASPATRLLSSLPAGMSPGQKLNAILAQEGLLREPVAAAAPMGPVVLGVPLPPLPLPQVKLQPPEQQASVAEHEAAAAGAVGQRTPPQPTEVRSPVRAEQKAAEEGPSSTAAAATTTAGVGFSGAGNAVAGAGCAGGGDDESMGDPAPSEGDEALLQGGGSGGAPEVASAPTAVVA
ncbi:hypothetical protein HYH02_006230 [Chlamydomonas schloesseri]|uniref:Uncharacterized protein n=1 Tax=Chlamydomonas schloesseri TaxID=2026947 RepID=A0A836B697_9CHLO|nr:hypothetical protein HYH02_006230 [Chlamydomonas schloesseri]|eukprot:KAG2448881.1 hypothetical protein HYH02_006230 [Chlamydomonas schloesseri]